MSGPKPNCALCGVPLRRRANVIYSLDLSPGEPTFGWHADASGCWQKDGLPRDVIGSDAQAQLVVEIERRGPGRVLRRAAAVLPLG